MKSRLLMVAVACLLFLSASHLAAQSVGDTVQLQSQDPRGVPVHPSAGDLSFVRWDNGTKGKVTTIDQATGWFKVEASGKVGWVVKKYLTVVPAEDEEPSGNEILTYVVGTWNLEWLKDGSDRGFPEYNDGGPRYGSRTDEDFQQIAETITNTLDAKILVLNEINGGNNNRSKELDRLLGYLGGAWTYRIASSGRSQRTAILYDSSAARNDKCVEFNIGEEKLQGKDIFERDPLVCKFTFLGNNGSPQNDMVVVGVHLASGQQLVQNHNKAMEALRKRLHQAFDNGELPAGEKDVIVAGDLNASRYDNKVEDFWDSYDSAGFKFHTLSPENGDDYHPTRLAGVPLIPKSQIDYLMGSGMTGGILDELVQLNAHVHKELLSNGFDDFREHVSDHLPVTVKLRVGKDED